MMSSLLFLYLCFTQILNIMTSLMEKVLGPLSLFQVADIIAKNALTKWLGILNMVMSLHAK